MLPIRNISYLLSMCCSFWEKCKNSTKTGLGCSTPLILRISLPDIHSNDKICIYNLDLQITWYKCSNVNIRCFHCILANFRLVAITYLNTFACMIWHVSGAPNIYIELIYIRFRFSTKRVKIMKRSKLKNHRISIRNIIRHTATKSYDIIL